MRTKVADVQALAERQSLCVKVGDLKIVLVKSGGTAYAIENHCPHLGLPLGRGKIDGEEIVCPFHGSRFNVRTGENTDWVAAVGGMSLPNWSRTLLAFGKKPRPVRTFAVTIQGGDILVDI